MPPFFSLNVCVYIYMYRCVYNCVIFRERKQGEREREIWMKKEVGEGRGLYKCRE